MKPWFYNEQSITEFKEPVAYKGLNISVSKTKVKPPYIAIVTSPATSKEVLRTGGNTEQEALDSAKQAVDKREADAPKISASGQTSILFNTPSNDELLKDPSAYNDFYAKISKDQNGPTLVIGNEIYGAADLEADGFRRSDRRNPKKAGEDALPQVAVNASNKTLSQMGIKMNGRYTMDIEGKYEDDKGHTVYPLQFQSSTIHAGDKERMKKPGLTIGMKREDVEPWFQREFEEAEIIKFPEPVKNVVELPNVQSYPDFLTGVKDLQNRLGKGEISQDSHDRLYQDLIHRFMRKESFENPWFLREAPADQGIMSLPQAQRIKALSKQVASLPKDVSDRIIDKIASAVELAQQKDKKGGEQTMFKKTALALKNTGDEDMKKYYKEVARYMLGNGLTSKEITTIINAIAQDNCVKMDELKKPENLLSRIIPTSTMSLETKKYYRSLFGASEYGVGPGELLFATHSPTLRKKGAGDLTVIDSSGDPTGKEIEVKAKRKKAARFVDRATAPTGDYMTMANNFMKKYKGKIPMSADGASFNHIRTGIQNMDPQQVEQVKDEVGAMVLSLFNSEEKKNKIINNLFSPAYNENKLKAFWATACIERYFNAKKGGMGILFCRLLGDDIQTNYAEDFTAFNSFAKVNAVGTVYPVSKERSYPFPQTDVSLQ